MNKRSSRQVADTVVDLLEESGGDTLLVEVAHELQQVAEETEKEHTIRVTSAIRLNEDQLTRLQKFFQSVLGRQYPVNNRVDPAVLGGMRIEWGDWMLDMTLRNRLDRLKRNII